MLLPILAILGLYVFFLIYLLTIGLIIRPQAINAVNEAKIAAEALKQKNLAQAKVNLAVVQEEVKSIGNKYKLVSWMKYVPLLGGYVADSGELIYSSSIGLDTAQILIAAIEPYADILGFQGSETQLNIESAEDKIIFILETMDKISPQLETVGTQMNLIDTSIGKINPKRYPQSFAGRPVRSQLVTVQTSLHSTQESLKNIKPLLALLPKLLGQPDKQTYLLVFQNEAEIRGSGGFLTALAILEAHRGKITPLVSQDIYELDAKFGNRLPAPDPIKKYLPLVYNWHLRDMNLSGDFKVAMDTFFPNYKEVANFKDVDGIIAMDTNIVVDLLKVLGPVGVAEWGSYDAEIVPQCNCPQVVYKMEDYATRPTYYIKTNRKGMIGPLMHSILLNVMNSPKKMWPQFLEVGLTNIKEKHLMFYFPDDPEMQAVSESFNAAGRVKEYAGDYFYLNDTNFAGAKSNLFVEQKIEQEIAVVDGQIEKTVTITYTNPQPPDDCNLESGGLCLNGLLRDWVRLYVPEGSEVIEVLGSNIEKTTSKELGKTVIEAFIELRPESRTKLVVKYRLPQTVSANDYKMLIQKQPGAKNHDYVVSFGGQTEEFKLDADRELIF